MPAQAPAPATVEDTWILSRLQAAEAEVADAIGAFEFHRATRALYRFIYGELCDWYLEMLKPRLYAEDNAATARVRALRAGRDARARAPGDPVRDRGDLVAACPAPSDLLMGHRWPDADRGAARRGGRGARSRGRSRPRRRCASGATASARRPGARVPARLEADGYERVADHVGRLSRFEFSPNGDEPVATVGVPGGNVAVLAVRHRRPGGREAPRRRARRTCSQGDQARRGQARQPGLRGQGAGGRRRRPSATSSTSCKKELDELS